LTFTGKIFNRMRERPITSVPRPVLTLLAIAVATQIAVKLFTPAPIAKAQDLPDAPASAVLRLASFGDPRTFAKLLMLYVQAYDYRAGNTISYQNLDYGHLENWLSRIIKLDPESQYPLLAASRLYAEVPNESKQRSMLEFIYRHFLDDPNRRWPWMAHAAFLAKHRLRDLPLARRYAHALAEHATAADIPPWVGQMEIFVLEDMNELQAARIAIGAYVQSGRLTDPAERRFLEKQLTRIEAKSGTGGSQ